MMKGVCVNSDNRYSEVIWKHIWDFRVSVVSRTALYRIRIQSIRSIWNRSSWCSDLDCLSAAMGTMPELPSNFWLKTRSIAYTGRSLARLMKR